MMDQLDGAMNVLIEGSLENRLRIGSIDHFNWCLVFGVGGRAWVHLSRLLVGSVIGVRGSGYHGIYTS
jgi:hypothetical protein